MAFHCEMGAHFSQECLGNEWSSRIYFAVFVALLLSFIIANTSAYEDMQNNAVIPTYISLKLAPHSSELEVENTGTTYISPAIIPRIDIQRLQIICTRTILTIRTLARTRRIHHISRLLSKEALHVLPTGTVARQRDVRQLTLLAGDDDVPRDRCD